MTSCDWKSRGGEGYWNPSVRPLRKSWGREERERDRGEGMRGRREQKKGGGVEKRIEDGGRREGWGGGEEKRGRERRREERQGECLLRTIEQNRGWNGPITVLQKSKKMHVTEMKGPVRGRRSMQDGGGHTVWLVP